MESHASISPDVLARYAADAALEVDGVHSLVSSHLPRHRPVRIVVGDDGRVSVEVHLIAEWEPNKPASLALLADEPIVQVGNVIASAVHLDPTAVKVMGFAIAGGLCFLATAIAERTRDPG